MFQDIHGDPEFRSMVGAIVDKLEPAFQRLGITLTLDRRARLMAQIIGEQLLIVMVQRDTQAEPAVIDCPHCGEPAKRKQRRTREIKTLTGPTKVRRSIYRCADCGETSVPLDDRFGIVDGTGTSNALREIIALLYADETTRAAVAHVYKLLGFRLALSTLHRAARVEGARAEEILRAEAEVAKRPETLRRCELAPAEFSLRRDDTALIEIDGNMLHQREAGWSETKLGVISDLGARIEKPPSAGECRRAEAEGRSPRGRESLARKSYVADARSLDGFRDRVWAEGLRWGLPWAATLVVVADGAPWIWNLVAELFASVRHRVEIIDWRHALNHLREAATARHGDTVVGQRYIARWTRKLWEEGAAKALSQALSRAAKSAPSVASRATLLRESRYFSHHATRMNYPSFRASGYPVGTGAVDSACGTVCQDRCKRSGMWWCVDGLSACLSLREFLLNDRWHELYPQAA